MNQNSTFYFFQYSNFAGKEHSFLLNTDYLFDYDFWLFSKINDLIEKSPDVPDELVKTILKKANVS